jgi:translation initiation factor eIF-2B subunit alpha
LPIEQKVLDFKVAEEPKEEQKAKSDEEQRNVFDEAIADMATKGSTVAPLDAHDAVDFTVRSVHSA